MREGKIMNEQKYRLPNFNEKLKLQRYFEQLHSAALFVKQHFIGKSMIYETESEIVEVRFSSTNFMHLCGIHYTEGAAQFFEACLNHHVVVDKIKIKDDGTTFQKLQLLPSIAELLGDYVCLTGSGKYLYLEFDYALRTNKQILALTLKDTSRKIVPQSLLYLKRKNVFPKGEKVVKIYSRHLQSSELIPYFDKKD